MYICMHETYVCKLRVERIYVLLHFSAIRVVNIFPVHIFTYICFCFTSYDKFIVYSCPGPRLLLLLVYTINKYHASVGIHSSTGVYLVPVPRTAVWCVTGTAVRIMNKIVEYN